MTLTASLNAGDLASAAARAATLARPGIVPILQHALLRFGSEGLLVAGTNLNQSVGMHVPAEGKGTATVDAGALSAFVRRLRPKEAVDLGVTKTGLLAITQGSARAELPYLPSDELTIELGVANGVEWDVPGPVLADALSNVAFAMDELRDYIMGAFLDMTGLVACLVATDGHVMAVEPIPDTPIVPFTPRSTNSTIIPRDAIPIIANLVKGHERVTLVLSDYAMGVRAGAMVYRTKLIDGSFPAWQRLMPRTRVNPIVAVAKRDDLVEAVNRAFAFDHGIATLTFDTDHVQVGGSSYATMKVRHSGTAACESCDLVSMKGGPITMHFSSQRLSESLASLPGADVLTFDMDTPNDGVLIRDPERHTASVRLLMPMRG